MLATEFRIPLIVVVAAWAVFNGRDAAQAEGYVRLTDTQIVERWLARPAYERRCELAKDHAAMRLGTHVVLKGLQSNPGKLGPDAAAYAVKHSGNEKAEERRFARTIRSACREALAAAPLPPDRSEACRLPCPEAVEVTHLSDIDFVIACLRCEVGSEATQWLIRLRNSGGHGFAESYGERPSPEKMARVVLSGKFESDVRTERMAARMTNPPERRRLSAAEYQKACPAEPRRPPARRASERFRVE